MFQCLLFTHLVMYAHSLHQQEPFLWGAATAAYQIEGATSEDGRGPSIWDTFSLIPGKIHNSDNGLIADDSYHKILTDIQLIKNMGLNAYRFSLSWSRIMPSGYGGINQAGIDHYQFLIDQLINADIEPLVTLYHWDLPQGLEDRYGGWLSSDIEVDFSNYADVCFSQFGDRVKKWTTLNEPWTAALQGYVTGHFAPGRCSDRTSCAAGNSSTEGYIAAHNMLNAHAAVVALYREKYQASQKGIIGITLNLDFAAPLRTDSQSDVTAAQRRNEFALGWFSDPIVFGRYPQSMVDLVGDRLPVFTDQQRARLTLSYDFIGLNHYSTKYYFDSRDRSTAAHMAASCPQSVSGALFNATDGTYTAAPLTTKWGGWSDDQLTVESKYDTSCLLIGPQADSTWLNVVPWGFHRVVMWLHDRYAVEEVIVVSGGNTTSRFTGPLIYITENGCDAPGESTMGIQEALNDTFRVDYLSQYLQQLDRAIADGANVAGYFAWSLLDNFEWADGFSKRFGLHYVDYASPDRPRYAKSSAAWYAAYALAHKDTYPGRIVTSGSGDDDVNEAPVPVVPHTEEESCSDWRSCLWSAISHAVEANLGGMQLFDL